MAHISCHKAFVLPGQHRFGVNPLCGAGVHIGCFSHVNKPRPSTVHYHHFWGNAASRAGKARCKHKSDSMLSGSNQVQACSCSHGDSSAYRRSSSLQLSRTLTGGEPSQNPLGRRVDKQGAGVAPARAPAHLRARHGQHRVHRVPRQARHALLLQLDQVWLCACVAHRMIWGYSVLVLRSTRCSMFSCRARCTRPGCNELHARHAPPCCLSCSRCG